jgi:hypothetical protein
MTEQVEQQTAPEAPATTEGTERIELNINDLAAMKSLIDVVTQRGAFKAGELSSVGVLYDRLSKFLAAVPPAPEQVPPQGE